MLVIVIKVMGHPLKTRLCNPHSMDILTIWFQFLCPVKNFCCNLITFFTLKRKLYIFELPTQFFTLFHFPITWMVAQRSQTCFCLNMHKGRAVFSSSNYCPDNSHWEQIIKNQIRIFDGIPCSWNVWATSLEVLLNICHSNQTLNRYRYRMDMHANGIAQKLSGQMQVNECALISHSMHINRQRLSACGKGVSLFDMIDLTIFCLHMVRIPNLFTIGVIRKLTDFMSSSDYM